MFLEQHAASISVGTSVPHHPETIDLTGVPQRAAFGPDSEDHDLPIVDLLSDVRKKSTRRCAEVDSPPPLQQQQQQRKRKRNQKAVNGGDLEEQLTGEQISQLELQASFHK